MNIIKKNYMRFYLLGLLSGLLFLSGCASTQQSNFYHFEESVDIALTGVEKGYVVGVGPIQLPEYLNRPQIVTRNSEYHLNVSEFNRWLEPLNDSIIRLLVVNLSNNLQSNRVYWIPRQDRNIPLDIRIVIDIGRFDGKLGKNVSLESRWTIFNHNNQPALTRVSLINQKVNGPAYEDLVIAMSQALKSLGKEISIASIPFLEAPR
ncbi:MAG: PqiC family protein [gamma proteobacterium symbiont of Taylorina sp.]|nr:PqiC family protein [gamma proteobacterium symbiont of Taylorina sp.]